MVEVLIQILKTLYLAVHVLLILQSYGTLAFKNQWIFNNNPLIWNYQSTVQLSNWNILLIAFYLLDV